MNHLSDSLASDPAPVVSAPSTPDYITDPASGRTPRHDGWTPDKREQFLEALRGLSDIGSAAADVGMGRSSVYALKRRDQEFSDAWDDAVQQGLDHVRGLAFASGMRTLSTEKYDREGNLVMRSEKPNDRMLIFLLNKYDHHAYDDYGRRPSAHKNNQMGYARSVRREGPYEYHLEPIGPNDLGPDDVEEGLTLLEQNRQYQAELKARLQEVEAREAALGIQGTDSSTDSSTNASSTNIPPANMPTNPDMAGDDDPAESLSPYRPITGQTIATLRNECSEWLEGAVNEATALAALAKSAAEAGEESDEADEDVIPPPEIEGHRIRPRRYTLMDYGRIERDVIFLLWWSARFGIAQDDPVYPRNLLDALNRDVDIWVNEIEDAFMVMRDHPSVQAVPGHWAPIP